jgi:hypothetical protein
MPNILINPESGFLEFNTGSASGSAFDTSLSGAARLKFENSGELNLTSLGTGVADKFSIDGSNGRLLTVNNTVTGSIFSVNDVAGLPIVEVFSDDRVVMGQYATDALVVSGSDVSFANLPTISGQTFITGFAEGDTLQTVTDRGATTTNAVSLNNGAIISKAAQGILSASRSDAGTATFSLSATNGDTQITFQNLAASKFTLGNDGTNNSFRISEGSALGTNDRFVILNGGDVGIGTNAPLGTTHIYTADAGGAIATNASHDDLIIENNGNCGIQLSSPANSYQYLAFGDTASANQGYVRYYHDNNSMTLRAGGTDTLTISGANVGIGTAVPTDKLHVYGSVRGDFKLEGNFQGSSTDVGKFTYGYTPRGGDSNNKTIASVSAYNTTTDSTAGGSLRISTRATNSTLQERIRVNQDGQVDIYGNASFGSYLYHQGDEDTNIKFNTDEIIINVGGAAFFRATETTQNSIKLNSDFADTDFYLYGNDGTPALFMRGSDRQIGINTASPTHALHIDNDGNTLPAKILIDSTTTADASIEFSHNGTYGFIMGSDESDRFFKISSGNALGTNDRFVIDTAGNVGIGTAAPQKKEHIYFNGNDGLRIESTNNHAFTQIMAHNSYSAYIQFRDSSNRYWLECKSDDTLQFRPNATSSDDNKVTFDAIGQVGVGITSPAAKLQVYTSANRHTKILGSTADLEVISDNNTNPIALIKGIGTADLLNVFDNTTEVFTILDGGDVGIGSASPSTKLDVGGIATADALRARAGNINYNLITRNDAAYSLYVQASQSAAQQQIASFRYGDGAAGQGTEVLSVKRGVSYFNNSFLGIGKAGADTALDVNGVTTSLGFHTSTANTTYALLSRNSAGNSALYVQSANSETNQPIALFSYGSASANAGTKVLKVGKDISYFDNTDVGIGTVSPQTRLTVEDALHPLDVNRTDGSSALIQLRTQGGIRGYLGASSTDSFSVWNSTPTRLFTVRNGGNVGINVSDPDEKLEVAGKTHLGGRGQDGGAYIAYATLSETQGGAATILGNAVYAGAASNVYRKTYNDAGNFIKLVYSKGVTFHTNVTGNAGSAEYPIDQHEKMRIDLNGLVGIGTDNPSAQFFNNLVVGNNTAGDKGITIRSNSANKGVLAFSDTDAGDANRYDGYIAYDHSNQDMFFYADAANERFRLDSIGARVVGTLRADALNNKANTANIIYRSSTTTFIGNSSHFVAQDGGNVGIGSNNPGNKLTVVGGKVEVKGSNDTSAVEGMIMRTSSSSSQGLLMVEGSSAGSLTNSLARATILSATASSTALQLGAAGVIRATIASNGNVGIGTNVPGSTFDLRGNMRLDSGGSTDRSIYFRNQSSQAKIQSDASLQFDVGVSASPSVAMFIKEDSRHVGIGTNNPGTRLHVRSSAADCILRLQAADSTTHNSTISFGDNDSNGIGSIQYAHNGDSMRFATAGTEAVRIDSSQRVGIGTNSVLGVLQVNGRALVEGPTVPSTVTISDSGDASKAIRIGYEPTWDVGSISASDFGAGWKNIVIAPHAGKVGIGTTSPHQPLSVKGTIVSYNSSYVQVAGMTNSSNHGRLYANNSAGVTNVLLDSDGVSYLNGDKVGIGTASPFGQLDIFSTRNTEAGASAASNYHLHLHNPGDDTSESIGIGFGITSAMDAIGAAIAHERKDSSSAGDLYFSTRPNGGSVTRRMTIDQDGKVGIGTESPSSPLVVINDSTDDGITLKDDGGGLVTIIGSDGSHNARTRFYNGAHSLVAEINANAGSSTYFNAGDVGIGTASPSSKLHVEDTSSTSPLRAYNGSRYAAMGANNNAAWIQAGGSPTHGLRLSAGGNGSLSVYASRGVAIGEYPTTDPGADNFTVAGDVGFGTTTPISPLQVENTLNALADTDEPENYHLFLRAPNNTNNHGVGIAFGRSSSTNDVGAGIIYKRTNSSAKGELQFYNKQNTTDDGAVTLAMVIKDDGDVGINLSNPANKLSVNGNAAVGSSYASSTAPTNGLIVEGNVGIGTASSNEKLWVEGTVRIKVYTFSALPAASTAGQRAFISDSYYQMSSSMFAYSVYGGGSYFAPVYSDGSQWLYG